MGTWDIWRTVYTDAGAVIDQNRSLVWLSLPESFIFEPPLQGTLKTDLHQHIELSVMFVCLSVVCVSDRFTP